MDSTMKITETDKGTQIEAEGVEINKAAAEQAPLRFLSNIHDPNDPHARRHMAYSSHAYGDRALMEQEWRWHMEWVNANVIGEPKATEAYTSEQLKAMGLVGLYAKD